ncbi:Serine/threonine-protein kinase PknE [Rosistilla carotiformis]|uniref:Serine/threonine-protein kinase PknE n=1 Tax=Rosistilla carotiformis TaxID=2528017 RepID=A0A518JRF2_9BACT|nr:family 16 glycoside hydrolase [Rosistilla carotiformis]QDV68119.1 Serine/threonine-protein kinase PknE [Rosistilla carotiformis]
MSGNSPSQRSRSQAAIVNEALLNEFVNGRLDSATELRVAAMIECNPALQAHIVTIAGAGFLKRVEAAKTAAPCATQGDPCVGEKRVSKSYSNAPPAGLPIELAQCTDYQIFKELGRGGMGVVYLAKYVPMDRVEVLKVLSEQLVKKDVAKQRFRNEMRAIGKLNHPAIATAYQQVPLPTQLVFSMEYVPGIDLHRFIRKYHPVPIPVACALAFQIAEALQHANSKQTVHRDIKPSNVMVFKEDGNLRIKILDFGLAKASSERDSEGLTVDGTMLGTPEYMAPEQALNAAGADIRADIYSLGCTLYHLLMGKPPFVGNFQSILMSHAQQEAEYISFTRLDVPVELSEIIATMMAKNPSKRYATPNQVAEALKPFAGKASIKSQTRLEPAKIDTHFDFASPSRDTSTEQPASTIDPVLATAGNSQRSVAASISDLKVVDRRFTKSIPSAKRHRSAAGRFKPPPKLGIAIGGSFLAALLATVFMFRTGEGTIVIENAPEDSEVLVDQESIRLSWNKGKDVATVRVKPGTRHVEVRSGGNRIAGETVSIESNENKLIVVSLTNDIEPESHASLKTTPSPAPVPIDSSPSVEGIINGDFSDGLNGWTLEGGATGFRNFTHDGQPGLTTFGTQKDHNKGRMFQTFRVPMYAEALSFNVHGGRNQDTLWIALLHNQVSVNRVTGKNSTQGFDVEWDLSSLRGENVTLEIVDKSNAIYGFIGICWIKIIPDIQLKAARQDAAATGSALFNGVDLTGWKGDERFWSVESGCIVGRCSADTLTQNRIYLFSDVQTSGDFELAFDCKVSSGGNSGVIYRAIQTDQNPIALGYQIDVNLQRKASGSNYEAEGRGILASVANKVVINPDGNARIEKTRQDAEALSQVVKPDAWNHYRVVAKGRTMTHWINGWLMSQVTDEDLTNFRSKGSIGLQLHGWVPMEVRFKDIILQTKPDGFVSLFDGSDTDAWQELGPFEFRDGLLIGNGKRGNAISRKEYGDFELVADWKIGTGANSGIYYREPATRLVKFGNEYAISDDIFDGMEVPEDKKTGSLYGVVPASTDLKTRVGQWNTSRIVCRRSEVQHWLNGRPTAFYSTEGEQWLKLLESNRLSEAQKQQIGIRNQGHILLQSNSGEIAFRDVRIRELKHEPAELIDLEEGSILHGTRSYIEGFWEGKTVSYSLHINKRSGKTFEGYKYDQRERTNMATVEGLIEGNTIQWTETNGTTVYEASGVFIDGVITFAFTGNFSGRPGTQGVGKIAWP